MRVSSCFRLEGLMVVVLAAILLWDSSSTNAECSVKRAKDENGHYSIVHSPNETKIVSLNSDDMLSGGIVGNMVASSGCKTDTNKTAVSVLKKRRTIKTTSRQTSAKSNGGSLRTRPRPNGSISRFKKNETSVQFMGETLTAPSNVELGAKITSMINNLLPSFGGFTQSADQPSNKNKDNKNETEESDEGQYVSIHAPMPNTQNLDTANILNVIDMIAEIPDYHWDAQSEEELLSAPRLWFLKRAEMFEPGKIHWYTKNDASAWHGTENYQRWRRGIARPKSLAYAERQIYLLTHTFFPKRCYVTQLFGKSHRVACWFEQFVRCAKKYPDAFIDFLCQPCWFVPTDPKADVLDPSKKKPMYPDPPWRDQNGNVNGTEPWMQKCDELRPLMVINDCPARGDDSHPGGEDEGVDE